MKSFSYSIKDKVGLHARPSSKLIQLLSGYKSVVTVKHDGKQATARSIINLMSLGTSYGSKIEFLIEGEDEDKLLADLPGILEQLGI